MGIRVYIPNARLSYPHLFVPKAVDNGTPRYQCALHVPKSDPVVAQLKAAHDQIFAQEFQATGKKVGKPLPMKDGDDPNVGVPGCWVINTGSTAKPHVVDQNVQPILDPDVLYAGCYVNASVSVYAYFQQMGNGITFGLDGVQFARDGERLDGRPDVGQLFQPVAGAPAPVAPAAGFGAPAFGAPPAPGFQAPGPVAPAFGAPAAGAWGAATPPSSPAPAFGAPPIAGPSW